eukprot:7758595-Karenia_brevis.AAC.1
MTVDLSKDSLSKVVFDQVNPHKADTAAFKKYEVLKTAGTVAEARRLGASKWDLGIYLEKGTMTVMGTEEVAETPGR